MTVSHGVFVPFYPDEAVREQVLMLLKKQEKRAQARQQRVAASQQQQHVQKLVNFVLTYENLNSVNEQLAELQNLTRNIAYSLPVFL